MAGWIFQIIMGSLGSIATMICSTLGWGGIAALLAGILLVFALSTKAMKFVKSPRGMAITAGVMLAGLAVMAIWGSVAGVPATGDAVAEAETEEEEAEATEVVDESPFTAPLLGGGALAGGGIAAPLLPFVPTPTPGRNVAATKPPFLNHHAPTKPVHHVGSVTTRSAAPAAAPPQSKGTARTPTGHSTQKLAAAAAAPSKPKATAPTPAKPSTPKPVAPAITPPKPKAPVAAPIRPATPKAAPPRLLASPTPNPSGGIQAQSDHHRPSVGSNGNRRRGLDAGRSLDSYNPPMFSSGGSQSQAHHNNSRGSNGNRHRGIDAGRLMFPDELLFPPGGSFGGFGGHLGGHPGMAGHMGGFGGHPGGGHMGGGHR